MVPNKGYPINFLNRRIITLLVLLIPGLGVFAQNTTKATPTIPLDTLLTLTITRLDTAELACYNTYYFNYGNKAGRFIADKSLPALNLLTSQKYRLCGVTGFCHIDPLTGKRSDVRACASIEGMGYYVDGLLDKKHPYYDFRVDANFPTLKLCDQK